MIQQQVLQNCYFADGAFIIKSKKNDAMVRTPFAKNHFAKILIVGDQNPVLIECFVENLVVGQSLSLVEYRKHFVAFSK